MSDEENSASIAEAIHDHVEQGAYPESQELAAADVNVQAIPVVLKVIGKARSEVEYEIRQISKGSASDVDNWISQAKLLQADIERSKQTAREIVQEAEASNSLRANVVDAGNKAKLLRGELRFNQTLADTLEQLQIASGVLDSAKEAIAEDALLVGLDKLENAEKILAQLDPFESSRFPRLLRRREAHIRELLSTRIWDCWSKIVVVKPAQRCITLSADSQDLSFTASEIATAMSRMGILESAVNRLHRDLDHVIMGPRFTAAADGAMAGLLIDSEGLHVAGRIEDPAADAVVTDLRHVVEYINEKLPAGISQPLLEKMLPSLELQLVSKWLDPVVPVDLDEMAQFDPMLTQISDFAEYLSSFDIDMPSESSLGAWVDRLPQTWLARRREVALEKLRSSGYKAVKTRKTAELVETQVVADDDIMNAKAEAEDEWNDWAEDEETMESKPGLRNSPPHQEIDDEDVSAWGGEEEEEVAEDNKVNNDPAEDGDEADAWGWGDEADEKGEISPAAAKKPKPNGKPHTKTPTEREVTLREAYAITALPDAIAELIQDVLRDAETLSSGDFPIHQLTVAAPALSTLPTLLLAGYRATANAYYASDPAANMLMYNDTQRLSSIVTKLVASINPQHPLARRLRLDADIRQLETFAKRAYGREMDSQRTIVRDLLSSASGFVNCSAPINAREYHNTVDNVIERIKDVNKSWEDVLSQSARLQSIGSLLGAMISKMVTDILELADGDISEEQSRVLKGLCDQVATLSSIFEQRDPSGEVRALVGVYVPGWFRFMYLAEVLEASLAYIKDMWMEYGLHLEFTQGEIIDLIEALFADSDYRKNAIREIKASGKGM